MTVLPVDGQFLETFLYKLFCGHVLSLLCGKYLKMELLTHMGGISSAV